MSSRGTNQPPYQGAMYPPAMASPPALPRPAARPQRPWPLGAVNRWISAGVIAITLLAVLLAVLAPKAAAGPPSTAGLQPLYHSSLTSNDGAWESASACAFTADGLLISAPAATIAQPCSLSKAIPRDFLLKVRLVGSDQNAAVNFLSDYVLEILGSGRFQVFRLDGGGQVLPLVPRAAGIGAGSIALHPSGLGTSSRANDLVILVRGTVYSFYANGQLLTRYSDTRSASAGPIRLYAIGGQALFTDLAIYPAP